MARPRSRRWHARRSPNAGGGAVASTSWGEGRWGRRGRAREPAPYNHFAPAPDRDKVLARQRWKRTLGHRDPTVSYGVVTCTGIKIPAGRALSSPHEHPIAAPDGAMEEPWSWGSDSHRRRLPDVGGRRIAPASIQTSPAVSAAPDAHLRAGPNRGARRANRRLSLRRKRSPRVRTWVVAASESLIGVPGHHHLAGPDL